MLLLWTGTTPSVPELFCSCASTFGSTGPKSRSRHGSISGNTYSPEFRSGLSTALGLEGLGSSQEAASASSLLTSASPSASEK